MIRALAILLALAASAPLGAAPFLVADLDTEPTFGSGSNPRSFFELDDGDVYFIATDGGPGLWRSDGTTDGTVRIADVCSDCGFGFSEVFPVGDPSVRFLHRGAQVLRTDGTPEGTFSVGEVEGELERKVYVSGRDLWIFSARLSLTGDFSPEIWRSDGTVEGTFEILEFTSQEIFPVGAAVGLDQVALFQLVVGSTSGLWRTDGTAEGTQLIQAFEGGDFRGDMAVLDDQAIFFVDDGVHGVELWRSDGTVEGTSMIVELAPGADGLHGNLRPFVLDDAVLFVGEAGLDEGAHLWRTDGTAAGTFPLTTADHLTRDDSQIYAVIDGVAYFYIDSSEIGDELWRSDGTLEGTWLIGDVCPGPCGSQPGFHERRIAVNGSDVYFAADDGVRGIELWLGGGEPGEAALVAETCPGPCSGEPTALIPFAGGALMLAFEASGEELWWVDPGGSVRLTDLPGFHTAGPDLVSVGPVAIFAANGPEGNEPWVTDGTVGGTDLLADLDQDLVTNRGSNPAALTVLGDTLYFTADDASNARDLWRTEGTEESTQIVATFDETPTRSPGSLRSALGLLFLGPRFNFEESPLQTFDGTRFTELCSSECPSLSMTAETSTHLFLLRSGQLWASDGTPAGTLPVLPDETTVFPIPGDSSVVAAGDRAVFFAEDADFSIGLWASDGTPEGTGPVETDPPLGGFLPELLRLGDKAYFPFYTGSGFEIWGTDGTTAGTMSATPGLDASSIEGFKVLGDAIYFNATHAGSGVLWRIDQIGLTQLAETNVGAKPFGVVGELLFYIDELSFPAALWRTDGSPEGTFLVNDEVFVFADGIPFQPIAVGERLLFASADFSTQLWSSDGTAAGTRSLGEFDIGFDSPLLAVDDVAVLRHEDTLLGSELWRTDGTADGTFPITDINPGPASADPQTPVVFGSHLVFSADDGRLGRELWAMPLSDLDFGLDRRLALADDGRFQATVRFRGHDGVEDTATVVPLRTDDSGLFWFFDEDNWEMLVKIVDACSFNDRFWVFAAATTDVEYTLTVTDTVTGESSEYFNPLGRRAPAITDSNAFATCDASSMAPVESTISAPVTKSDQLFLGDGRFRVELTFRGHDGEDGLGMAVPGSTDSGLFWFFDDQNWEMLVKIIDACDFNDRYWVYAAATTDVAYTLTVTDTATGQFTRYDNALGQRADAITDTDAFASCP